MNNKKYLSKDTLKEIYIYMAELGLGRTFKDEKNRSFVKIQSYFENIDDHDDIFKTIYDITRGKEKNLDAELDFLQNKIELKDIIPIIFDIKFLLTRDSSFIKVLKKIHNEYPEVAIDLHNYISQNRKKEYFDTSLYDAYYQLLKSNKTDKSLINKKEILENIKNFRISPDNYTTALNATEIRYISKKINIYVSLFQNNIELYNFIMEDLKPAIEKSVVIKDLFEQTLTKFSKEAQNSYYNSELSKKTDLIEDRVLSKYEIFIDKDFLISRYKVRQKMASELIGSLYSVLFQHYQSNYKIEEKNYIFNGNALSISSTEQEIEKVRIHFRRLKRHIPDMFKKAIDSGIKIEYSSIELKNFLKQLMEEAEIINRRDDLNALLPLKEKKGKILKV